ncbi:MAG: hypothetical protein NT176_20190, partial [Proteobacteria bacterium]|nr:hypothetical protein [Pseudomonadota bacterium]
SASNTLVEPLIVACLAFGPALCIGRRGGAADRSGHVAILSFLAVLPMATAFGTGNFPYWTLAGLTAIAWSCAAVMLAMLLCASRGGLRLLMMSVPLVAAASLATTIVQLDRTPWRSPAEPSGRFAACDLGSLGTLMLDESLAADIRGLRATCAAAGLSAGDDVLAFFDMPGIPLVLGARAPGASWIISGYPASDAAALVVLGSVPMPRRAAAWVLIRTPALAAATNGEGRNPDVGTLLRNVGVDFPSSHRFVSAVPFHMWDKTVVIEIWRPAAGHS